MDLNTSILIVSRDPSLLQTRRLILGAYFQVEAAVRLSEAGALLSHRDFELIVLCDTIPDFECLQIADLVRDRHPRPTLLTLMAQGRKRRFSESGRWLTCGHSPIELLKACAQVLGNGMRMNKQRLFAA